MATQELDPQAIIERSRRARGDQFWEAIRLVPYVPEAVVAGGAFHGYAHRYAGQEDGRQELSVQMRELIATVLLCYRGQGRFAANHVRKLYRHGVTNAVIVEAFLSAAPILGWSNNLQGIAAIHLANEPSNLEGELPPGGEPKELVDFPELHLGEGRNEARAADSGLANRPEWEYIAKIDPILAERGQAYHNLIYSDAGAEWNLHLPPAARELVAIAALCVRGAVELAAERIRRARRYGVSARQILEAAASALPMTGMPTLQFCAQAMMQAGVEPGS
jgi:alkylhydroperoxidase/carboxymuconolactone decarboxylase family protein YurZ